MKVFCMKKRGDKVYTQIVNNCSASEIVPIIKKSAPDDSAICGDKREACDRFAKCRLQSDTLQRRFLQTEELI